MVKLCKIKKVAAIIYLHLPNFSFPQHFLRFLLPWYFIFPSVVVSRPTLCTTAALGAGVINAINQIAECKNTETMEATGR